MRQDATRPAPQHYKGVRGQVRGAVITERDEGYDDARRVYNAMHDRRPTTIVRCTDAADVIAALRFARDAGGTSRTGRRTWRARVRHERWRDGHRPAPIKGIRVDPRARTALSIARRRRELRHRYIVEYRLHPVKDVLVGIYLIPLEHTRALLVLYR